MIAFTLFQAVYCGIVYGITWIPVRSCSTLAHPSLYSYLTTPCFLMLESVLALTKKDILYSNKTIYALPCHRFGPVPMHRGINSFLLHHGSCAYQTLTPLESKSKQKQLMFRLMAFTDDVGASLHHGKFLWIQIAGVVFPVPILLLIPAREYLLPRFFGKNNLAELDPAPYESAEDLPSSVQRNHREADVSQGNSRPGNHLAEELEASQSQKGSGTLHVEIA